MGWEELGIVGWSSVPRGRCQMTAQSQPQVQGQGNMGLPGVLQMGATHKSPWVQGTHQPETRGRTVWLPLGSGRRGVTPSVSGGRGGDHDVGSRATTMTFVLNEGGF